MGKMQQLAEDIKALEELLNACTQCGMCQAVCPLFEETRKEMDVSRGKIVLINGLLQQMFKDAKGVNERLNRCLLCGACAEKCPSNVDTLQIFLRARGIITRYLGLPFVKKLMLRRVLANPETFNLLTGIAAPFQKLFFKKEENIQGTSCARIASPLLRNRHITPLKGKGFIKGLENPDIPDGEKGIKVAFFVGCLIDKALPNIAYSTVDVLNYFNVQVLIPENQGCCGIPSAAAGDEKTFDELVRMNVDLFSSQEFDYLVTACATCSSTIINLWPSLAGHGDKEFKEKLVALAQKTVDISWLLEKQFDIFGAGQPKDGADALPAVTYHDPCHLKKSLGIYTEPRQVIKAAGHELIEMANSDACCGMGGSFNLEHYGISSAIGRKKADSIVQTGCSIAAASCPACIMQITDMLAASDSEIVVRHPVELYAAQLEKLHLLKTSVQEE